MMLRERSAFGHRIRTEHGSFITARFVRGLIALIKETMTRSNEFLTRIQSGEVILADGAIGTLLQSMGLPTGTAPEAWVLEEPEKIRAMHRSYVRAGSNLLLSCSFGGTRFRLLSHGLGARVVEINRRAAELAREVAGEHVWVAGDMGPTGQLLQPLGKLSSDEVADAYAEQATGLAQGGADLLLIETMSDLGEAQAAIEGARRATDLPIACTFSFDSHGRTMMGLKPETVANKIGPLVEVLGANCGRDPAEFVDIVDAMRKTAPGMTLWAKPNAGLPHMVDETVVYDAGAEYMGQLARQLQEAGAQILGGCCGTTPDHVSAMAATLQCRVVTH
jgi:5-methyltetrahydrofolate--homocysteine methyltransferase